MQDRQVVATIAILLTVATLAAPSAAQGIGTAINGPVDIDTLSTNNGALGVAWFQGQYWVSSRGTGAVAPHLFYVIDTGGNLTATYQQDAAANTSAWGCRDGATDAVYTNDGTGTLITPETTMFFGYEGGILAYDGSNTAGVANLATTYNCANGTLPLPANPIAGPGLAVSNIYRAVAYDPWLDGGNGGLITASFSSDIVVIDMSGNILYQAPFAGAAPPNQWSAYGLAHDPFSGNMWVNSSPNGGEIRELQYDSANLVASTFAETGGKYQPDQFPLNVQGGLDKMVNNLTYPTPGTGVYSHAALTQGTPDSLTAHRVHLYSTLYGPNENQLATSVGTFDPCTGMFNTGPLDTLGKNFRGGDQLTFDWIMNDPALVGAPVLVLVGLDAPGLGLTDGTTVASTLGNILPEVTMPNALSVPVALSPIVLADGFGFGSVLGTVIPIWAGGQGLGALGPLIIGAGGSLGSTPGDAISMQALVFNPGSGGLANLVATNRVTVTSIGGANPSNITVSATGANSFNADVTSGFFKIQKFSAALAPIVDVTFDLTPIAGMLFDTDQAGMANAFWEGNSTGVGTCAGTYRNGSDASTGLIYDCANTYIETTACGGTGSTCDPESNCGFTAIGATATVNSWLGLNFRFTPGVFVCGTFEFDCDTDGGPGTSGANLAGMIVTITLSDATVLNGVLAVDPNDPNRSFLQF